jgi:hypothetical protein
MVVNPRLMNTILGRASVRNFDKKDRSRKNSEELVKKRIEIITKKSS